MTELSCDQVEAINRLIDDNDHAADLERRTVQAFRSGLLSKGLRTASGDLQPTLPRQWNCTGNGLPNDRRSDKLIRYRNSEIHH